MGSNTVSLAILSKETVAKGDSYSSSSRTPHDSTVFSYRLHIWKLLHLQ